MADAGRILIIPKGDYDANSTYDKLDLVKYKGTSWLAKKVTTGNEPSEANAEYWQDMFEPNIANNLTTTEEGYALDARQGQALVERITAVNDNMIYSQKIYQYMRDLPFYQKGLSTLQFFVAMPAFTEITVISNTDWNVSDAPSAYGMLTIRKGSNDSYGSCEFRTVVSNRADLWIGSFQSGVFSGWSNMSITNWQQLTLASSFEKYTTDSEIRCRKIGDLVCVRGVVKPKVDIEIGKTSVITTLPVGFRPLLNSYIARMQGSGLNSWMLQINTFGDVSVSRYGIMNDSTIPAGAWLPIDITFAV